MNLQGFGGVLRSTTCAIGGARFYGPPLISIVGPKEHVEGVLVVFAVHADHSRSITLSDT